MTDERTPDAHADAVASLRHSWEGRLSSLQGPGGDARLRRAMRRPVRLGGLRAGAPEPEPADGAVVLAKAARRTGRWLKLTPELFHAVSGLSSDGDVAPQPETPEWDRCLTLVRLGGKLERMLGRRGVVCTWLRARNLALEPTPIAVLAMPDGLAAVMGYLDQFER